MKDSSPLENKGIIIVNKDRYFVAEKEMHYPFILLSTEEMGQVIKEALDRKIKPEEKAFVIPVDYGEGELVGSHDPGKEGPLIKWVVFHEIFMRPERRLPE